MVGNRGNRKTEYYYTLTTIQSIKIQLFFPHTAMYNFKMKYDESDNLVIRASRAVTDRLGDAFGGVVTQSDMAEALAEIYKIDPSFTREDFMKQCQFEIIPTVLEAFLRGDSGVLKDWCYEPVSC